MFWLAATISERRISCNQSVETVDGVVGERVVRRLELEEQVWRRTRRYKAVVHILFSVLMVIVGRVESVTVSTTQARIILLIAWFD